jgi:hypothetical protein
MPGHPRLFAENYQSDQRASMNPVAVVRLGSISVPRYFMELIGGIEPSS